MKPAIQAKNILSKWLIVTMLLIGFFTFSGSAASTYPNRVTTPITLVVKTKARISSAIWYHIQNTANKPLNGHYLTAALINDSQLYNQLVAVNFKIHCSRMIVKPAAILFFRARSIPQNGADEPAIS